MSDAPNAIWIDLERIPSRHTCSPSEATPHDVKYIRADLSDALLREAMEALGMAVDDLDEWVACGDSLAQAGFNMDGTADCAERARATLDKLRAHFGEAPMTPTDEELLALADRLESPAYWFSGSDEGHEGENAVPHEAAAALRAIVAEQQTLKGQTND